MLTTILREHPELAIFLLLALGFLLGNIKIGSFKIGIVLGTLFAGVLIGQLDIRVPRIVQTIFFDFFLFATGYKVGPQFFQGLKKNAVPQLLLTLVICTSCLLIAYTLSTLLGYDIGTAAGLLAGAFSESTIIGTASETIKHLTLPEIEKTRLINNIPVAYAVTYLVGATSFVFFLTVIAPKLLGINLIEESSKLKESISDIEKNAKEVDPLDRLSPETDIVFVGLGIFLGGLLGLLSVTVFGISITLTTSGGALVMGLIFGWLHSKTPAFGRIPEPAIWIFDNVGLATFIGLVGLAAGPGFISSLKETGFGIVFAGIAVAIIPHIIGLYFGRYVLKINPIILLGAQTGAGTSTIGLKAIQDASASKFPVLGYTIPYALGNILLTAFGPILIGMMT